MKRPILLLLFLFSTLLGCEQAEPFLPTVTFDRMDVQSLDWDGVAADFVFDIYNPNPVAVQAARFDYALAFEGVGFLDGDAPDGWLLAASGSSELALPAHFGFQTLYDMVQAVRGKDDIDFNLDGSFGFDTPLGPLDLPFAEAGDFPAPRRPTLELDRLVLDSLSFTGADLTLDILVDNDHGANLRFLDLEWNLDLAGLSVAAASLADLGQVDGASQQVFSVPISLNFLETGVALYQALTKRSIDASFSASVQVDTPFGMLPLDWSRSRSLNLVR